MITAKGKFLWIGVVLLVFAILIYGCTFSKTLTEQQEPSQKSPVRQEIEKQNGHTERQQQRQENKLETITLYVQNIT
ncbi:hypothetical protein KKC1_24860 [Calderihabitans maritimus]|uniref:Uncharacterized protein n=1 Tax=Calderihabitans maritimus TaxID=1246530 RepID=A0A1Z5HUY8_9FIRM|nr:hypothetical protein KKC1_24860 [Calderihabitans maritimus]